MGRYNGSAQIGSQNDSPQMMHFEPASELGVAHRRSSPRARTPDRQPVVPSDSKRSAIVRRIANWPSICEGSVGAVYGCDRDDRGWGP